MFGHLLSNDEFIQSKIEDRKKEKEKKTENGIQCLR